MDTLVFLGLVALVLLVACHDVGLGMTAASVSALVVIRWPE